METLECFQTPECHGNDVVAHWGMLPPSLPADSVNICRDKLLCRSALYFDALKAAAFNGIQMYDVTIYSMCEHGAEFIYQPTISEWQLEKNKTELSVWKRRIFIRKCLVPCKE